MSSKVELTPEVIKFIEENIELIEKQRWDQIYTTANMHPDGFTEAMLAAGINPLLQGLTYIPRSYLFNSSIEYFTIPEHIQGIEDYAFFGCNKLGSLIIPDAVKNIGTWAFTGCHKLKNLAIGKNVESIGSYAFFGCDSLREITINQPLTKVNYELTEGFFKLLRTDTKIKKIICTDGEIDLT